MDKRGILISSLDAAVLKRLYHLLQPRDVTDVPFEDVVKTLDEHFAPKRFERAKLFSTRQEENEPVKDFLNRLRAIHATFEYETEADIRACSSDSLHSRHTRSAYSAKLVLEKNLTIEIALRLAGSSLAAEAGSRDMGSLVVAKVSQSTRTTGKCFRCGNFNNDEANCRFRQESYHDCGKRGHIVSMCTHTGRTSQKSKNKSSRRKVQTVTISNVFSVDNGDVKFSLRYSCEILGTKVTLQGDTGSQATLLNRSTCLNPIKVLGRSFLYVRWRDHLFSLEAIITEAPTVNILGRTWTSALMIDLNKMFVGVTNTVADRGKIPETLLQKHPGVFRDGLGRCTTTKVHLQFKPDSHPKFFNSRPIPLAIRTAVKQDLERKVNNGVRPLKLPLGLRSSSSYPNQMALYVFVEISA
ncbi:uncharacterized protein LOC135373597 [Ornithodoros turicata]|uniref:uncharacterized protein LOC135373597 n=1 Tax=Ornithodoros turicata TaxID=34597 RepID=UPI0031391661